MNRRISRRFFWIVLILVVGCLRPPTRFIPPRTPFPDQDFVVIRDVAVTWNALSRALESHGGIRIKSADRKGRTIEMEPTAVEIQTYCDCGRMGEVPISGRASRKGTITLTPTAPQETMISIKAHYETTRDWRNAQGSVIRTETIPCVSNGRFERLLYKRILSYLGP